MRFLIFTFTILLFACSSPSEKKKNSKTAEMEKIQNPNNNSIDWQGHRGARGILPENTIPAFLEALKYPVSTLELDIAISKDGKVIVSHEPWFNHQISSHPDGTPITEAEEKDLKIYEMTYEEIKKFDVGSRGNARFPDQKPMKVSKPSLADMVKAVDEYCEKNNHPKPNFNIEIKSEPDYYGKFTPAPEEYVRIVLEDVKNSGIENRSNLQSFDLNILEEIHKQSPSTIVAYLIESNPDVEANLKMLSFKPHIYSPYFILLTKEIIDGLHAQNIKVIPWTVNKKEDMKRMIEIGVDGIITDFPNYINEVNNE